MDNPLDYNGMRLRHSEADPLPEAMDIDIVTDDPKAASFDPVTKTVRIEGADGNIVIEEAQEENDDASDHDANLAGKIDAIELGRVADELLRGIQIDDDSRQDWLSTTSAGIDLLGLVIKTPQAGSAQHEGTSKVVHPLLKEAVLRFQANSRGELLPSDGPIKVRDDNNTAQGGELAQLLQDDLNHYLTTTASEYYPDTDRALLFTGFRGCSFKKVYRCPIRRRPISESVDAKDLIVSNAATDLKSCGRVTHRVMMRPAVLRRMQLAGAYRDIELASAMPASLNAVDQKIGQVQGIAPPSAIDPRDHDREIYECYTETEIKGFEHKEEGKETGLPLPWKITIDKDSKQVLEVRRNWDEDDDQCMPRTVFVKYPFVPGFGFYDIGLLQILGDTTLAATAGWREMLDAGAFSCFPGFLYVKALGKQLTNEFRVPPGGGMPIDTNNMPINQSIMPLPYQPPSQAMMALIQDVVQTGQRVGGTADLPVGEGKQDAPVGTTLALIEQATKVMDAVHKRLHQAQSQEFQLLKQRFMEDPEALWRHNKKSKVLAYLMAKDAAADPQIAMQQARKDQLDEARKRQFVEALADYDLVPMADPNTSSQMSRIMKAVALKQLQMQSPGLYDPQEVDKRILKSIGWNDPESLFAPPAPPQETPPDPRMLMAQAKLAEVQVKVAELQNKQRNESDDRALEYYKQQVAVHTAELNLEKERIIHANDAAQSRAKLQADVFDRTISRDTEMQKHRDTIAAGLLKHHTSVNADMHKHTGALIADRLSQETEHAHQRDMSKNQQPGAKG